jgi:uncharacterized Zn finger protein (UPF0148 family)
MVAMGWHNRADAMGVQERGGNAMEGRKCPKCGLIRYSAVTRAWICERCGSVVTSKDRIENRISVAELVAINKRRISAIIQLQKWKKDKPDAVISIDAVLVLLKSIGGIKETPAKEQEQR